MSRAWLWSLPWFIRNQISEAALARNYQWHGDFFSEVLTWSGWLKGFPCEQWQRQPHPQLQTFFQLRFHIFAPQHGGTRAWEEFKKFQSLANSTHNFKLYFPTWFPFSWNTVVVVSQLQSLRTSQWANCNPVHLKPGRCIVAQNIALQKEAASNSDEI